VFRAIVSLILFGNIPQSSSPRSHDGLFVGGEIANLSPEQVFPSNSRFRFLKAKEKKEKKGISVRKFSVFSGIEGVDPAKN
jgi:hypothetical protein